MSYQLPRVAVIGAGAGGLTALKSLIELGLAPVAFEASSRLGGVWVYRDSENQRGPGYRSLRTNTSKQITAFSDLPFGAEVPDFPGRSNVEQYLGEYARTFGLEPFVRFGVRVESLRRSADEKWVVAASTIGEQQFDWVVVCSGIFRRPVIPAVDGLDTFTGEVIHSIDYRVPEPFAGRHVLIVGLGSSAVDIANDLLTVADRVSISTRRGAWVVPREVCGRPLDHQASRLFLSLPGPARRVLRQQAILREYERRGLQQPTHLWGSRGIPFHPKVAPSVTSDQIARHVQSGTIDAKPAISHIRAETVKFVDGSRLCPHAIILCTGYSPDFPFLPSELIPWSTAEHGLYRLVFPPGTAGLAFIGVCRAQGPILPIVEMQARWVAQVVAGKLSLPTPAAMWREIQERVRKQHRRNDIPFRVPLTPYLDTIGWEIGVKPTLLRHPRLLGPILSGPPVAAQYRLQGPNGWPGAADVVRASKSIRKPTP
jgi:dimethylaniline monooxygenase (N-oxide forming)